VIGKSRAEDAILIARFSHDLTAAAMREIDRVAVGQDENATLTESALRRAIFFGISGHLRDEAEKQRNKVALPGSSRPAGDQQ
jgi:hypothetical protein